MAHATLLVRSLASMRVNDSEHCTCRPVCSTLEPTTSELSRIWQAFFDEMERQGHYRFERLLSVIPAVETLAVNHASISAARSADPANVGLCVWETLGPDVVTHILSLAGIAATGAAAAVNRALRESTLHDDVLWERHTRTLLAVVRTSTNTRSVWTALALQLPVGPGKPNCGWRALARCVRDGERLEHWSHQVSQIKDQTVSAALSVSAESTAYVRGARSDEEWALILTHKRLEDARRRLSLLALKDFREAQRVATPPQSLAMATVLLRLLLEGVDEVSTTYSSIESSSRSSSSSTSDLETSSIEWFRQSMPSLGARFGEQAQEHVGALLSRMLSFEPADTPTERLDAVEAAFPRVCMARLDQAMRISMQAKGGITDECRVLRVASAVTRWVVAIVMDVRVRRRMRDCATVLDELGDCLEALFAQLWGELGPVGGTGRQAGLELEPRY